VDVKKVPELFSLVAGDLITRKSLYTLVQTSKVRGSSGWSGPELTIGNTPQQGINWIGPPAAVRGAIVKARKGAYRNDGWIDAASIRYRYSFKVVKRKARKPILNLNDTANAVLISQPRSGYPILVLIGERTDWRVAGWFDVEIVEKRAVILCRTGTIPAPSDPDVLPIDPEFGEGNRKYVTHLRAERSRAAINAVKRARTWICEICDETFEHKYSVRYIEAHHKVPLQNFSEHHRITLSELALLCPSCHRAVHGHMRLGESDFVTIRKKLRQLLRAFRSGKALAR
jgi:putative restriction endonuclease